MLRAQALTDPPRSFPRQQDPQQPQGRRSPWATEAFRAAYLHWGETGTGTRTAYPASYPGEEAGERSFPPTDPLPRTLRGASWCRGRAWPRVAEGAAGSTNAECLREPADPPPATVSCLAGNVPFGGKCGEVQGCPSGRSPTGRRISGVCLCLGSAGPEPRREAEGLRLCSRCPARRGLKVLPGCSPSSWGPD